MKEQAYSYKPCLWFFLSISAFVSINFCNFAVKNYQTIVFT